MPSSLATKFEPSDAHTSPEKSPTDMTATGLFSQDYTQARAKFRAAASRAGATLTAHRHPSAKGPNGDDIFIDIAVSGPANAAHAVLIISGTHGVEGYAGSAIQTGWLTDPAVTHANTKLVYVHALNPYGFAWNRRVNEENVDLNRNFVDWTQAPPVNADYALLADAIAPEGLSPDAVEAASRAFRTYAKEKGAFAMQETVSKGQYTHPDGLYYGGAREQWSASELRRIVQSHLSQCGKVAVIDIHTGLGPYGEAELISEDFTTSPAYLRARAWYGESVASTRSGDSVSAQVYGSLDSAIPAMMPKAETTMICLEYGTYSTLEVFSALRADNWLHTRAAPGTPSAEIKAQIRRAFYPDQDDWKEKVWNRGKTVITQALQGLTQD